MLLKEVVHVAKKHPTANGDDVFCSVVLECRERMHIDDERAFRRGVANGPAEREGTVRMATRARDDRDMVDSGASQSSGYMGRRRCCLSISRQGAMRERRTYDRLYRGVACPRLDGDCMGLMHVPTRGATDPGPLDACRP